MLTTSKSAKAILGVTALGSLAITDTTFAAAQTFLGDKSSTQFRQGITSAQVQITVDGGKITDINTVSIQGTPGWPASCIVSTITARALSAQSANVQGVSCASYSSLAWRQSLASAIAKAGNAITGVVTTPATPASPTTPTPAPTRTIAPAPQSQSGGDDLNEHEGGGDDGGVVLGERERHGRPVAPVVPIVPKTTAAPAAPKASATPTSSSLGLTLGAGVIKKSITCVKGKLTKTVKAVNPKCPTGYTLKK